MVAGAETEEGMADTYPENWAGIEEPKGADWHSLEHGPYVVYLLAHARRDAFYIDVAANIEAIREAWSLIVCQQKATLPESQWIPPCLVWFEPAGDEASAQARAKHVRTLPHAWQRRLVDAMNPTWLDLYAYFRRMPLRHLPTVGEQRLVLCGDLMFHRLQTYTD